MKNSFIKLCMAASLAGALMLGGCGSSGGGGDTPPTPPAPPVEPPAPPVEPDPTPPSPPTTPATADVTVSAAGSVTDAGPTVDTTYTMTAGEYVYSIAGFGKGDKLVFPATQTPTVNNSDFTDGMVDVQWSFGGQTIIVRLTGLTAEQDIALYSANSFNNHFGEGSLK